MKKFLLAMLLVLLTTVFAGCQQTTELSSNGIVDEDTGSGDLSVINPDNNGNNSEGSTPEVPEPETPNPENPENPQQPVEPNPEPGETVGQIEEPADKGYKFAGNGSYTDKANPAKLAFYDDINGVPRDITNNLIGDLAAGIQFIQTHNIAPSGNSANARPTLVPYRPALLVLTTNTFYKQIKADIKDNNGNIYRVKMDPPRDMPDVDTTKPEKAPVTFSNKSWSIMVPEKYLVPNMEITFVATDEEGNEYTGVLPKEDIEYSTPTEVVYFFIRLGMLTDAPATKDGFYMLNQPVRAMQEYFQTVPFARVVNATYEPRRLDMVILNNGTIYDTTGKRGATASTTNGGWYDGDMRQAVAKVQYSAGVNLANRGVSSSAINESSDDHQREKDPLYMVVHHARGNYKNGVQVHGLSGGAGMFTLSDSKGNEFSHELGHGYGLGHYVDGGWTTTGVIHSYDTGWGYDSYRNRIRGSLSWGSNGANSQSYGGRTVPAFNNKYNWNKDTMSGGWAESAISQYTHLTARTMMKVQDYAKNRYKLSDEKIDGKYRYQYWDNNEKAYKLVTEDLNAGFLSARRTATERGVPVITILGGYNPNNIDQAVVYPYFRANYGHVFGDLFLDEPPYSKTYLKIEYYGTDAVKYVELSDVVLSGSQVNKMHVNIPESSKPKKVTLYIRGETKTDVAGYSTDIPENLTPMNAAVIIGKDYGYKAVIQSDIAELEKGLESLDVNAYGLTTRQKDIIESLKYNDAISSLTGNTKVIVDDYLQSMQYVDELNMYLEKNYEKIEQKDEETLNGLKEIVAKAGYIQTRYTPLLLKVNNGSKCIEVRSSANIIEGFGVSCDENSDSQKWFMDSYARIRSVSNPDLCVSADIETAGLEKCGHDLKFYWKEYSPANNKTSYKNLSNDKCLDLSGSNGKLITWNCNNQENQKFAPKLVKADTPYTNSGVLIFGGTKCFKVNDNKTQTFTDCTSDSYDINDDSIQWFIDKSGRIHSAKYPSYCIEAPKFDSSIVKCSDSNGQKWIKYDNNSNQYYKNVQANSCMGRDLNRNVMTVWDCSQHKVNQQIKYLPIEENSAISSYTGDMIDELDLILANK